MESPLFNSDPHDQLAKIVTALDKANITQGSAETLDYRMQKQAALQAFATLMLQTQPLIKLFQRNS